MFFSSNKLNKNMLIIKKTLFLLLTVIIVCVLLITTIFANYPEIQLKDSNEIFGNDVYKVMLFASSDSVSASKGELIYDSDLLSYSSCSSGYSEWVTECNVTSEGHLSFAAVKSSMFSEFEAATPFLIVEFKVNPEYAIKLKGQTTKIEAIKLETSDGISQIKVADTLLISPKINVTADNTSTTEPTLDNSPNKQIPVLIWIEIGIGSAVIVVVTILFLKKKKQF